MTPSPQKRAFIIRPFGTKKDIDFDRIERELIAPALAQAGVDGRTTLDILGQGNIRVDMFQRLLTADLVVADLSIHNANVFYELGIRHALRDKRTLLVRCQADAFPFDLQTDRYFVYEKENPAQSLELLVQALHQTLSSDKLDSPVFHLLPGLTAQDPGRFLPVPQGFQEAVQAAVANKQFGDLELLAEEVQDLEWAVQGLRVVGQAQMNVKALESARATWEAVVKAEPMDVEGNLLLGTVYQRFGDLSKSDRALARVLSHQELPVDQRAEADALLARNSKTQWVDEWHGQTEDVRQTTALRSPFLEQSYSSYFYAFQSDLNHFYSGLNALAMLTVLVDLAERLPEVWEERFEEVEEAEKALIRKKKDREQLSAGVELSLNAALARLKQQRTIDVWVNISQADFFCLTSKRPTRVVDAYRRALTEAPDFAVDAARQQLVLYRKLGVLSENVEAVLSDPVFKGTEKISPVSNFPQRVILFTGHMIDKPDRPEPRFPANKEGIARQFIQEALLREREEGGGIAFGLAGGASGGDLLFHEIWQELGIVSRLYLAIPSDQFIQASVAPAGSEWVERFLRLYQEKLDQQSGKLLPSSTDLRVLADSKDLPRWLQDKQDYTIWQRNNLWMLHNALVEGGAQVTVIALWNGEEGDGPGGTADLVAKAQQRGAKTIILNTKEIF
jgi:hypothetical protein